MEIAKKRSFLASSSQPKSYIVENLVAMWDGENNNGQGSHSDNVTTWKNLGSTGSTYDATRSIVNWGSNYAQFNSSTSWFTAATSGFLSNVLKGEWTVEVIFSPDSNWFSNYSGIFGYHWGTTGRGLCFGQYGDGAIGFDLYEPSETFWNAATSDFTIGNVYSIVMTASASGLVKKCFCNNVVKCNQSITSSNATFTCAQQIAIGTAAPLGGSARTFNGKIFCVRCYDRMLSDAELTQNFNLDQQRFFQ